MLSLYLFLICSSLRLSCLSLLASRKPTTTALPYHSLTQRRFDNFGVGLVLRSEHSAVKAGDHVYGILPFQEYTVVAEPDQLGSNIFRVLENKEGIPWSVYVGVCGMPGEYGHLFYELHQVTRSMV